MFHPCFMMSYDVLWCFMYVGSLLIALSVSNAQGCCRAGQKVFWKDGLSPRCFIAPFQNLVGPHHWYCCSGQPYQVKGRKMLQNWMLQPMRQMMLVSWDGCPIFLGSRLVTGHISFWRSQNYWEHVGGISSLIHIPRQEGGSSSALHCQSFGTRSDQVFDVFYQMVIRRRMQARTGDEQLSQQTFVSCTTVQDDSSTLSTIW